jgi:type II secretory pathway pseudopilin PulG
MTPRNEHGFSLIETMFAMGILATALLSLAAVFALGLNHLAGSTASLITWAQIHNVDRGGVFLVGPQPLRTPGPDGLVNTADDGELESALDAGADNILGTADDVRMPLAGYTRQIEIRDIVNSEGTVNANLRELRVTIGYQVAGTRRTYVLTTYISSIS